VTFEEVKQGNYSWRISCPRRIRSYISLFSGVYSCSHDSVDYMLVRSRHFYLHHRFRTESGIPSVYVMNTVVSVPEGKWSEVRCIPSRLKEHEAVFLGHPMSWCLLCELTYVASNA
jgi:hypothetical protein